jgi:hypothetical protein
MKKISPELISLFLGTEVHKVQNSITVTIVFLI